MTMRSRLTDTQVENIKKKMAAEVSDDVAEAIRYMESHQNSTEWLRDILNRCGSPSARKKRHDDALQTT